MLPGARIYKTVIAVTISLIVSRYVFHMMGFYMTIATVLSMKMDHHKSIEYGKNRMIGTLIGGAFGLVVMILIRHLLLIDHSSVLLLFINVITIFILLWSAKLLHLSESGTIAASTVFFVITLMHFDDPVLDYVTMRVLETLIGVAIATLVNMVNFKKKETEE